MDVSFGEDAKSIFASLHNYTDSPKDWMDIIVKCLDLIEPDKAKEQQIEAIQTSYRDFASTYPSYYGYKQSILYHIVKVYIRLNNIEKAQEYINEYLYNSIAKIAKKKPKLEDNYFSFRCFSEYSLLDIEKETISLTHPREFNDPLDTYLSLWLNKSIESSTDLYDTEFFTLLKKSAEHIKLRCFIGSEQGDISNMPILMWSHYADSHKGFCVQYKFQKEFFEKYSTPSCSLLLLKDIIYKDSISIPDTLNIEEALFTKSTDWKYENETRLVHYNTKECKLFPTICCKDCIKAIYLGVRVTEENRRKVEISIGDKNIQLYQMQIDENNLTKLKSVRIG